MKEPRTSMDFSKHEHRVEIFKSSENKIRVDHFQVDRNMANYIKFTNTDDNLTISGDYGNYVFCRAFIPSEEGSVSDMYWHEKLHYNSIQSFERQNLDFKSIIEELEQKIKDVKEDYSDDDQGAAKEFFEELLEAANGYDKLEYENSAYREISYPSFMDHEDVPYYREEHAMLRVVFDGFDEICKRIKNKSTK